MNPEGLNFTTNSLYGSLDMIESAANPQAPSRDANQQQQQAAMSSPKQVNSPPRPAIRQRQRIKAAQYNNNNDLSIAEIVGEDRQSSVANIMIQKEQEQLDKELVELNKTLLRGGNHNKSQSDDAGKGPLSLPLPTETSELAKAERDYPMKVLFIVVTECCERFSFYGFKTILILYLGGVLGLSDPNATVSFHLFAALCYVTPILGAILGDTVWGKFKTILYLSIVYFIGELMLVLAATFWESRQFSLVVTFMGLFVIGIGTGGIKPCVSALGGDQFEPHEERWRQSFFSLFYAAINLGSLSAMFLTPMLRSNVACVNRQDCYPLAFGLPCLLMLVAIVVFAMAKNRYTQVPLPPENVILAFCSCSWLAFKRRVTGFKMPLGNSSITPERRGNHQANQQSLLNNTSSSSLSVSSNEDDLLGTRKATMRPIADENTVAVRSNYDSQMELQKVPKPSHWLYLASDRFDTKSIEDFRSVLGILLLCVPMPVYWCLYDQQGSLWILQATRMDGRLFNSNFVLQPDQISVINPLIMITFIPIFELFIYPALNYCNLLTRPIQRMTVGGLLTALAFVLTAMIEVGIQHNQPVTLPPPSRANLLLVNGLSQCKLVDPKISYVPQIPTVLDGLSSSSIDSNFNRTIDDLASVHKLSNLQPYNAQSHDVISSEANLLNNYQLRFKLSSLNDSLTLSQLNAIENDGETISQVGCPFNTSMDYDLVFGPFPDGSTKLVYLDHGNGKLTYKVFNDSLELPPAGKARLSLLYEGFGSLAQRENRRFYLVRDSMQASNINNKTSVEFQQSFQTANIDGQVTLSHHLDITVAGSGETFSLRTNDNLLGPASNHKIYLEPGTRNLLIVHQKDGQNVDVRLKLLQDNHYRISILYQLGPYLLISIGEVMFSITGLEFSYSMAPDSMKSLVLAAWSLTTAFGNVLTVIIEALHLFASNMVYHFLFYAIILTIDMIIFAIIGYYFRPHRFLASSNK